MSSRSHAHNTHNTSTSSSLPSRPFTPPAITPDQQLPDLQTQLESAQRFGHYLKDFSARTDQSRSLVIQPKLTIGAPGDKYEREADRVAQAVVQRLHTPPSVQRSLNFSVQREMSLDDEETVQLKPLLQRQASIGAFTASSDVETAIQQSRGGGQPLAGSIRQPLEQAFGNTDFSGVRVHTDARADQLNRSIQAKAFTTGQDVFFRQGAYQPGSRGGQELLAHELTHVVQQNQGGIGSTVNRYPYVIQRAFQPAIISAARGVRLHQYTTGTKKWLWSERVGAQTTSVSSKGVETLNPYDRIEADPADTFQDSGCLSTTDYTKARSQGNNVGYIKDQHLTLGKQLGTTTGWALPSSPGKLKIWDTATATFITDEFNEIFKDSVMFVIENALLSEAATGIKIEKKELVDKITHSIQVSAGLGIEYDAKPWEEGMANIEDRIIPRINRDKNQLVTAGLITALHSLKEIEFTGADFHKGGQAPVFLIFETNNPLLPDRRKIVYKPSNLDVDKAIFNRQNSLAQALDNTGNEVSQYTIISNTEAGGVGNNGERYGYMEFVKSGAPTDANDLLGIWNSLGANVALSYIVGLEDIHQENILVKQNSIQIIDMEATTGKYASFSAMLWNKALLEKKWYQGETFESCKQWHFD